MWKIWNEIRYTKSAFSIIHNFNNILQHTSWIIAGLLLCTRTFYTFFTFCIIFLLKLFRLFLHMKQGDYAVTATQVISIHKKKPYYKWKYFILFQIQYNIFFYISCHIMYVSCMYTKHSSHITLQTICP